MPVEINYHFRWYLDTYLGSLHIASKNVPIHFFVTQEDCEMHVVSLVIWCGLGSKENTNTKEVNEDDKKKKVTEIVTPGEES